MAYDKIVDSAKLDAALTATAGAIRQKTGKTNKIVWDADTGFKGAVDAIQTGESGGGSGGTGGLDYLLRTDSGYIDTGVDGANSNLSLEIRYEFLAMPTGYWSVLSAYAGEGINATRITYNKNTAVYCCLNSPPNKSLTVTENRYTKVVYTDIIRPTSSTTFAYVTNGVSKSATRSSGEPLVGKNIVLFGQNADDGVSIKLYYLKIYDNGVMVRDFIPRYENGEFGLYDQKNGVFYGNDGEGTFEGVGNIGGSETEPEDISAELTAQDTLITALEEAVAGKATAQPNIHPLTITENGTYTASGEVDGYSPITVNVPTSGGTGGNFQTCNLTIVNDEGFVNSVTYNTVKGGLMLLGAFAKQPSIGTHVYKCAVGSTVVMDIIGGTDILVTWDGDVNVLQSDDYPYVARINGDATATFRRDD